MKKVFSLVAVIALVTFFLRHLLLHVPYLAKLMDKMYSLGTTKTGWKGIRLYGLYLPIRKSMAGHVLVLRTHTRRGD